jgi:hypothetical protein
MSDELTREEFHWLQSSQCEDLDLNELALMERGWKLCRAFDLAQAVQAESLSCPSSSVRYATMPDDSVYACDDGSEECKYCGWMKDRHGVR